MNARRLWQIGGTVVVVAILVVGWFAAVSPVLAQAAQNEIDRAAVAEENAAHDARLASLKSEYENIEALRAQFGELAAAIPPDAAMPALLREIANASAGSGVAISAIRSEDAADFIPGSAAPTDAAGAPVDEAAASDDSTTESGDAADTETPVALAADGTPVVDPTAGIVTVDPADLALLGARQFVTVPLSVEFVGNPDQLVAMASALQSMNRVFLVTTFRIESGEVSRATVTGLAYVLLDKDGLLTRGVEPPTDDSAPTPTETPAP